MKTETRKNTIKTAAVIIFSLAIAAFFMWLALRDLDFTKIKEAFLQANYYWMFAAFLFGVLGYWFRAARWNMFLKPLGYQISNSNAFWSISFGYLLNLTIPRSGEVARATALYGVEKVPVEKSFGTIILERIIDLFFMLLFFCLTAIFKFDALKSFFLYLNESKKGQKNSPTETGISWWFFVILIFVLLFLFYILFRKRIKKMKFSQKVKGFFTGIWEGIKSILKIENKGKFLLYSAGIWLSYFLAAYLVCFALPETSDFGISDGIFILSIGTLGMLVPASGGIGSFHLALKLGMMALYLSMNKSVDFGAEVGLSYAFLSHTLQLFIMVFFGLISIPVLAKARKV